MANPFRKIRQFYLETMAELKKSSRPDRKELQSSLMVVFIAILLLGTFVSLVDFSIFNVVDLLTMIAKGGK